MGIAVGAAAFVGLAGYGGKKGWDLYQASFSAKDAAVVVCFLIIIITLLIVVCFVINGLLLQSNPLYEEHGMNQANPLYEGSSV